MQQTHRAIRMLDEQVIGQIAAGEVVERPANAIKELVENSMDAGATAITVGIQDGGIARFDVVDNGCGIPPEDIRMAFARHATSKIRSAADLTAIASLGFRGEALASIAAVSRTTLTTRTRGATHGTRAVCEGGVIGAITDQASPEGTAISVRDLFFNTPARLKFLKKPATEAGAVADMMLRMILSRPDIAFRFTNNGRMVYRSTGDGDMRTAIFSTMGADVLPHLTHVQGHAGGILANGFVGVGEAARAARTHQLFFINGRYVRDALLSKALEAACQGQVMVGRVPICVLHLQFPLDAVDVNVHPNKLEVRFRDERGVYEGVLAVVRDAFAAARNVPEMQLPVANEPGQAPAAQPLAGQSSMISQSSAGPQPTTSPPHAEPPPQGLPLPAAEQAGPSGQPMRAPQAAMSGETAALWNAMRQQHTTLRDSAGTIPVRVQTAPPPIADHAQTLLRTGVGPRKTGETDQAASVVHANEISARKAPIAETMMQEAQQSIEQQTMTQADMAAEEETRLLGVAFDTYLLVQAEHALYFIDQHAAHERILYERMMRDLAQENVSQQLMVPILITLSPREEALYETHRSLLASIGFELAAFGARTLRMLATPVILGSAQAQSVLLALLDDLEAAQTLTTDVKRREMIVQMACKRAVKAGDRLTKMEVDALLAQMRETGAPPTCPHGRPIIIALTHHELDKRFRRSV